MAPSLEWPWRSLADAAAAVNAGDVSPVEPPRACLERIERVDHALHAFVSVDAERALQDARRAEREIQAGRSRGPLHGIPVGLKDNYDTLGVATRNGSRVFADRMPTEDATVWARLQEAGAVLLGKTTMSEAAWGVDFPPVRNPRDSASASVPVGDYLADLKKGVRGMRIGVPREHFWDRIEGRVATVVRQALHDLEAAGAKITEVSIPHMPTALGAILVTEMASVTAWHDKYLKQPERRAQYTPEVRALMDAGKLIFATDFLKAQRLRRALAQEVRAAFDDVDVLATPTLPLCAWDVSESHVQIDGRAEHVLHACWRFTYPWNLTGLPALSVPCGFAAELPVGLQLVGRPSDEATVLRVGHAYQEATRWHEKRPPDPAGRAG